MSSPINIFALHGFTGNGEDFDLLRAHCPAAWRWHCPDLPGHGKNPLRPVAGRLSLEAHLDFFESERRRVFGEKPCALFGYSLGGRLALHWSLRRPENFSALVLIGASPGIADDGERERRRCADEALAEKIISGDVSDFLIQWQTLPIFAGLKNLPAEELEKLRARRRAHSAGGLAASLCGVGTGAIPSLWGKLPFEKKPTLLIAGAKDEKFSRIAAEMRVSLPTAVQALIADAGHAAHLEAPEQTAAALINFYMHE